MSDHLSPAKLNALADGELMADELVIVMEHLHRCSPCTSRALEQSLLKSATARSGQRYALPDEARKRMERLISAQNQPSSAAKHKAPMGLSARWTTWAGWAVAAILLIAIGSTAVFEINVRRTQMSATERVALETEVSDQHIATLATNLPPQVLSSDRHTVKPWFQGKLPFSFNIPENLPQDTKLDGANLIYMHNRPAAQLLYSIGRHRVSVFVEQRSEGTEANVPVAEYAGFHLAGFSTSGLHVIAVSDVDPARLAELLSRIEQVQTK